MPPKLLKKPSTVKLIHHKISTQTHDYDKKLPSLNLDNPKISFSEVREEIILKTKNPKVYTCLYNVMNSDNFDCLNNLNAETLLCQIWEILPPDLFTVLESVLEEIVDKGPCVQGKTIRLYQLLVAILPS